MQFLPAWRPLAALGRLRKTEAVTRRIVVGSSNSTAPRLPPESITGSRGSPLNRWRHNLHLVGAVALFPVFVGIYYLSYWLRFEGRVESQGLECFTATAAWVATVKLAWFAGLRVCRGWGRSVTFYDLVVLLKAATAALLTLVLIDRFAMPSPTGIPRSVFLLDWGTTIVVSRRRPLAGPRVPRVALVAVCPSTAGAGVDRRSRRHGRIAAADDPPPPPPNLPRGRLHRRQSPAGRNAHRGRSGRRHSRDTRQLAERYGVQADPGHARRARRPATAHAHGRRPPRRLRGPRAAQLPATDRRQRDGSAAAGLDRRPAAARAGAAGHRGHPPVDRRPGDPGHRQRRQHRLGDLPAVAAILPAADRAGRSLGDRPVLPRTGIAAAGRARSRSTSASPTCSTSRACAAS